MRMKRAKTKKKGVFNVDELQAYAVAYGKPLGKRDYFGLIIAPAFFLSLFSFLLVYYWWVSLIVFLIGGIYGYSVIMPKTVKRNYEVRALQERNKFINNMTQILTDEDKTLVKALSQAKSRCAGELRNDINILEATLMSSDIDSVKAAFYDLNSKYKEDIVFSQYIEQLETAVLEGKTNIDTFKDIKTYHNDLVRKTKEYHMIKNGHKKDMTQMLIIIVCFILAITFSFSFTTYYEAFARGLVGWITSLLFFTIISLFLNNFVKLYFDDSIMEVSK